MKKETEVEYIPDSSVDASLDRELRKLLTTCFTKPQDVVFRDRRYFREPYPHRWVIRGARHAIVAHVGVHEKAVEAEGRWFRIGGIAEVCVHPEYRGRGFVRIMLACVDDWLRQHGFLFAVLFGMPCVYKSSGYVQVNNLFHTSETPAGQKCRKQVTAMVKELSDERWPSKDAYLPGPTF